MKKYILLFVTLLSVSVTAQKKHKSLFIETHQFPDSNKVFVYVSYKIPYNQILFVKKGVQFEGGINFSIEAVKNGNVISREFSNKMFYADNYEKTKSEKDFANGLLMLKLKTGQYNLIPEIILKNTNLSSKLKPIHVTINTDSVHSFLKPIVVSNELIDSSGIKKYKLVNIDGFIPFSKNNYGLVIPTKTGLNNVHVTIEQNSSEIVDTLLNEPIMKNCEIVDDGKNIIIDDSKKLLDYKCFYLNNFSYKLEEGKFKVTLESGSVKENYVMEVYWLDKPFSLFNVEFSVKLLDVIGKEKAADRIFSFPKEEYYKALVEFWNKNFPTKGFAFNDAMFEFYKRADYAIKNFAAIGKKNGVKTDRGKIYLIYGAPDEIKRRYTEMNNIEEIWHYNKLNKVFVFSDKSGLGNFVLIGKK